MHFMTSKTKVSALTHYTCACLWPIRMQHQLANETCACSWPIRMQHHIANRICALYVKKQLANKTFASMTNKMEIKQNFKLQCNFCKVLYETCIWGHVTSKFQINTLLTWTQHCNFLPRFNQCLAYTIPTLLNLRFGENKAKKENIFL